MISDEIRHLFSDMSFNYSRFDEELNEEVYNK